MTQPVAKKKQTSPKLKWALALLALGLALLALIIGNRALNNKEAPPGGHTEERIALIDRDEGELLRFAVRSSKGDAFTLIREGGGFAVEGKPGFLLDPLELELMVKDLTLLSANEEAGRVHLEEEALALLGLGKEAARVTASYADGSQVTLVFGDSAQTEIPADYLMVEGSDRVYTVSPETRDHFDRHLHTLHRIPGINFNPGLVREISFKGGDGFTLSQVEGLWEITSPFRYPASPGAVDSLLDSVGKMRFALYAGSMEEEDLRALGLEPPQREVVFSLYESVMTGFDKVGQAVGQEIVPAQELRFLAGDNIGAIGLYLAFDGSVYQASNVSMGFLRDTGLMGLLSPHPVNTPVNRLGKLAIQEGGQTDEYAIEMVEKVLPNNTIAQDELGNTLFEPFVQKNGQDIDSQAFLRDYLALMGLRSAGRLPAGFQTNEPAVKTYTFHQHGGVREVALFPYDPLHYALRVNGTFVDYVSKAAADGLGL